MKPALPQQFVDPVCGMQVDADAAPRSMNHHGQRYYFCSLACLEWFKADPDRYLRGHGRLDLIDQHIMRQAAQADEHTTEGRASSATTAPPSSTGAVPATHSKSRPSWEAVFRRVPENPILTVDDLPFRAAVIMNPGAAEQDGETVLLVRVEDAQGYSRIHVARSRDGVRDWRIEREPLLGYGDPDHPYEQWGCEDARVTYVEEHECWYVTYVAYSSMGPAVGLARTSDFVTVERLGLLGTTNDKDAVLLPRTFDGRWAILHRPDAGGREHIWSAYSLDLVRWGEPHCVMLEGVGPAWDQVRIGAGPPPIETDSGWLLIYHGVKAYAGRLIYRAGAALLDREQPHKLAARSRGWIFQAETPYELSGLVTNVVFPTGLLRDGDELRMYYGAADTCIGLATAKLEDVLATLDKVEPAPDLHRHSD